MGNLLRRGRLALLASIGVGALALAAGCTGGADTPVDTPQVSASVVPPQSLLKPPSTLPWGAAPPAGAEPGPNAGEMPVGVVAPKGMAPREGSAKRAAAANVTAADSDVYYYYGNGWETQASPADGLWADVDIAAPAYDMVGDYHTLVELAAINYNSTNGRNIVEVGWARNKPVFGDDQVHLFVFQWANDNGGCYNGCGFVTFGQGGAVPGMVLPTGVSKKFGLQHSGNAWWVIYDGKYVGYFPDSVWTSQNETFTKGTDLRVFGEVASTNATAPCSDMGNGLPGSNPAALRVRNVTYYNGGKPNMIGAVRPVAAQTAGIYNVTMQSTRSFRLGGPGGC
ncbi:neprosin family prolyl endopeptidase [Actinoplanes sp. URMC 104]|uniref:neprosin family prolyl endopeptidase n=1 Tax=Actinoplanes sp. URMC 104 TaxID=3423409 RepID=UPI003F1D4871